MLRIAKDCTTKGHNVTIFTGNWRGDKPSNIKIQILKSSGFFNHQRHQSLIKAMHFALLAEHFDFIVGFNRMAGLDAYYAADPCFVDRANHERGFLYKLMPRYHFFSNTEKAVMAIESSCKILSLTPREKQVFQTWYGTPDNRFYAIPPNIPFHKFSNIENQEARKMIRAELNIQQSAKILLMVGSAFVRKGVDRAIKAFSHLPSHLKENTYLLVVGEDDSDNMKQLAQKLGVEKHLLMLGARDDVPKIMMASDIFLHPARSELAGLVIIEAMTAGLPCIVTDLCGYAPHVTNSNAGIVLSHPFNQSALNDALFSLLTATDLVKYKLAAHDYLMKIAKNNSLSFEADLLEELALEKQNECVQ